MDRFLPPVDLARTQSLSGAQTDVRKMQPGKVLPVITLKEMKREYGTNGNNGANGISLGSSVCSVISVCSVF
jgi:hypothetical protein